MQQPRGTEETILVVDDDELVRSTVRRMLGRAGFVVLEADSAGAAATIWEQRRDDVALLITDTMLGDDFGDVLLRRMRADRPDVPAIVISGMTADMAQSNRDYPVNVEFLEKPFTMAGLLAAVRRGLGSAPAATSS